MTDFTNNEIEAQKWASKMAIEYLQELNEYDLRKLGQNKWRELIEIITKNFLEKKIELDLD